MKRVKLLSLIILLCASASSLMAQGTDTLALWNINVTTGPSPFPPPVSNSNVTVVGLTRGSGVGLPGSSPASNAWGGVAWSDGIDSTLQSATTAINNNNFFTFSFTANSGYTESLSTIAAYNIRRSSNGPDSMLWQYSLDTTNFTNIGSARFVGSNSVGAGNPQAAIDLSSISTLQNVPSGTTVTFRLVAWHTAAGTAADHFAADQGTFYFNGNAQSGPRPVVVKGSVAPSTPLPLNLISFKGQQSQNANQLNWVTAQEKYITHFELERSVDGSNFNKIAEINSALKSDNGGDNNYSYDDKNAPATSFYRLKIVEAGGNGIYSDVVVLRKSAQQNSIQLYPNPADGTLFVEGMNGASSYRITDAMGREVVSVVNFNSEVYNVKSINVSALTEGIYFIQLKDENGVETIRFVKK